MEERKNSIYSLLYVNVVPIISVILDDKETKIELQLSCQGHPLVDIFDIEYYVGINKLIFIFIE